MTRTTVDLVSLGPKLLVHHTALALGADEAGAMPVLALVRQVLGEAGSEQVFSYSFICLLTLQSMLITLLH